MTTKTKKTAEDWSINLTKISISLLFIASTILIFLGPWIVNLIIVFPSPLVQGEARYDEGADKDGQCRSKPVLLRRNLARAKSRIGPRLEREGKEIR